MKKFEYDTTCMTREATESQITAINEELEALANVPGDVMSYTVNRGIAKHLTTLRTKLYIDLEYFDAIDAALEQLLKTATKKYWVRANGKRDFPHDATVTAVYGTVEDARAYAYDHMQKPYGTTVVQIFDDDMNEIESYEI